MKQLKKSKNKVISGVCGGIAEYFDIDATIVRLAMCVVTVVKIPLGLIFYLAAIVLMPSSNGEFLLSDKENSENQSDFQSSSESEDNFSAEKETKSTGRKSSAPHTDDEFNKYFSNKKK